ncbi:MAG: ATP-binding protein [Negativicutes bacterium]|nr:ATP-binding protein [Negativicutes bacterium]
MSSLIQAYIQALQTEDRLIGEMLATRREAEATPEPDFAMGFVFDGGGRFLFVSCLGAANVNLRQGDMVGRHWREIGLNPQMMEPVESDIQEIFMTGKSLRRTIIVDSPVERGIRHLEYTASPLYDTDGKVGAVHQVVRNAIITEPPYEGVSKRKNLFYKLVEKTPIPTIIAGRDGTIQYMNKAYHDSRMLPDHYVVGKTLISVSEALGMKYEDLGLVKALKGQENYGVYQKINGRDWVVNSFPLRDAHNRIIAGIVTAQEVSKIVNLQEEMRKMDRFNLIGEMAAGVAHEIRNPLTVVKGYLQFLQNKVPEQLREWFQIALNELGRVENLITTFLSLAGNTISEKRIANLNVILQDLIPLVSAEALKRDILINPNLGAGLPDLLLDEKEIRQVILNLTRNAFDAMDKRGVLSIYTKTENNEIVLGVSDNGRGIPANQLEKIFDPFFTTKEDGTGLGLSICANIIKKHKGDIRVDSRENEGTSFIIRLPLYCEMATAKR